MLLPISLALLALPLAQAAHSPWARSKSHSRHAARAAHNATEKKFTYERAAVNTSEVDAVASTWYAGWHADEFPPENITWEKYTSLTYAFALTTPDIKDFAVAAEDDAILRKVVTLGRQNNVAISLSIGGWTGSRFFSSSVATAANRTAFIDAITKVYQNYTLDGIDFDWEYPNNVGIGCNVVSANDTTNFLSLLRELRASPALPKNATLSAAVGLKPFMGADNAPSADVSEFAQFLDYVAIMNYDVWGSWSETAGPNAPLNDTCVQNPSTQAVGSAVSGVKAWTDAGMPADKIVLAVASYGHSFAVKSADAFVSTGNKTLSPFPAFDAAAQPVGDRWQDPAGTDICGNNVPQGGNFDFWGLIEGGFLDTTGKAVAGIDYTFDECSKTPYVYNATSGVMVAYDDAASFTAKGEYIALAGLRGFSMWEAAGDYNDILLDAIRAGAGFPAIEDGDDDCTEGPTSTGAGTSSVAPPAVTSSVSFSQGVVTTSSSATATVTIAPGNVHAVSRTSSAPATTSTTIIDDDDDECEDPEETFTSTVTVSATATRSSTSAAATTTSVDDGEYCDDEDEE